MINGEVRECDAFRMLNMSVSICFGKTPKIWFRCWNCYSGNETRLSVKSVEYGSPNAKCEICGAINEIPIHFKNT